MSTHAQYTVEKSLDTHPDGTTGSVRSIVCRVGLTLFAMANELWKMSTLTSSNENVDGSPDAVVQEMVAGPPLVRLVGVLIVNALTKGRRTMRALGSRCENEHAGRQRRGDIRT